MGKLPRFWTKQRPGRYQEDIPLLQPRLPEDIQHITAVFGALNLEEVVLCLGLGGQAPEGL